MSACRVSLIPAYDAQIAEQIDATSKTVDKLYLTMLETTVAADSGRSYAKFANQYVAVEVELNSLLTKNKLRPLNKNSLKIIENTLELWQKYKGEHKADNTLSDGIIKLNRKTFNDLFFAMQVAEKEKK